MTLAHELAHYHLVSSLTTKEHGLYTENNGVVLCLAALCWRF